HSNGEACDAFNDHSGTAYFSFSGFSTNLETRKLANNVTASYSDIYFTVPDGNIYVSGSALAAGSIDFILTLGSVSKKVSVNPQGLITSEE
ncbi:MAG TPA: hypothetical protein VK255_03615, partial [Patescibacteria group bacterium]|nr:hypothetical protein [Patescibacteria group bacterium]